MGPFQTFRTKIKSFMNFQMSNWFLAILLGMLKTMRLSWTESLQSVYIQLLFYIYVQLLFNTAGCKTSVYTLVSFAVSYLIAHHNFMTTKCINLNLSTKHWRREWWCDGLPKSHAPEVVVDWKLLSVHESHPYTSHILSTHKLSSKNIHCNQLNPTSNINEYMIKRTDPWHWGFARLADPGRSVIYPCRYSCCTGVAPRRLVKQASLCMWHSSGHLLCFANCFGWTKVEPNTKNSSRSLSSFAHKRQTCRCSGVAAVETKAGFRLLCIWLIFARNKNSKARNNNC